MLANDMIKGFSTKTFWKYPAMLKMSIIYELLLIKKRVSWEWDDIKLSYKGKKRADLQNRKKYLYKTTKPNKNLTTRSINKSREERQETNIKSEIIKKVWVQERIRSKVRIDISTLEVLEV